MTDGRAAGRVVFPLGQKRHRQGSRRITPTELENLGQDTELVTLSEAAEALDVSSALIYLWVRNGAVPWTIVGGQLMVPLILASWYQRDQDHGYAAYRRGCRCQRCRSAYAAYRRAERAKRRENQNPN